jgi:nucleolar protein 9
VSKTPNNISESDYLGTLLRDSAASHLLETVVSRCPASVFDVIWKTYFEGKLARLAVHPVANFVVAKALERISESQLSRALQELDGVWKKLIRLYSIQHRS